MKTYTSTAYSIFRWWFIIWGIVCLVGGAVAAFDILTVQNSPLTWGDVAMSAALSFASFVGSFFVLVIRRAREVINDR